MQRFAFLVLLMACADDPVAPPLPMVTVSVTGRPDSMGTTHGCVGTFVMTSRAGPELTYVNVAVLHQDGAIQNTYQMYFTGNYALMAPYFPVEPGLPNAARFSYYARVPGQPDIPPQYIEAPCGQTVTRVH